MWQRDGSANVMIRTPKYRFAANLDTPSNSFLR